MTITSVWGAMTLLLSTASCGTGAPRVLHGFGTTHYAWPWQRLRVPHPGVDFTGDGEVIAMADGVIRIVIEDEDGTVVVIRHAGLGRDLRYGHLSLVPYLPEGSSIHRGEYLGVPWMPSYERWRAHVHIDVFEIGHTTHQDVMLLHPVCKSVAKPGQLIYPFHC